MKALSIWPEYAMEIAHGTKKEEYRSWTTKYRGPLLICSTQAHGVPGSIPGHAICVVDLVDIKKLGNKEYAWILDNVRLMRPVPVKGKLSLFEVDIEPEYIPNDISKDELDAWLEENFNSMMLKGTKKASSDRREEDNDEDIDNYQLSEKSLEVMRRLFGDNYKP